MISANLARSPLPSRLGQHAMGLLFWGLLAGCQGPAPECIDNGSCEDGQACIDGACRRVECLSGEDCRIGQYCAIQGGYVCTPGCNADTDCIAGERCDRQSRTCEEAGCRSAVLDCPVGAFCDPVSGACYEDGPELCATCTRASDCTVGGADGTCVSLTTSDRVCLYTCGDQDDCPAGFTCTQIYLNDPTTYCYADCPWLTENGYL